MRATALCRVIASELPQGTTVVIIDSVTSRWAIARIQQWIDVAGPATLTGPATGVEGRLSASA